MVVVVAALGSSYHIFNDRVVIDWILLGAQAPIATTYWFEEVPFSGQEKDGATRTRQKHKSSVSPCRLGPRQSHRSYPRHRHRRRQHLPHRPHPRHPRLLV